MRRCPRCFVAAAVVAGCVPSGADPRQPAGAPTVARAAPTAAARHRRDPLPSVLPRDDGPHDRLTEWWYYTGHLIGARRTWTRATANPPSSASSS